MKNTLWAAATAALSCAMASIFAPSASAATCQVHYFQANYYKTLMWPPFIIIDGDFSVTSGGTSGEVFAAVNYKSPSGSTLYIDSFNNVPIYVGVNGTIRITNQITDTTYRGPVGQYKLSIYFNTQFVNDPGNYTPSPMYI
jgi:hypothetical protein